MTVALNYVNAGTATVTAGQKTITFADVSLALMAAGDLFMQGGATGILDSLDLDAGTAQLVENWAGTTSDADPYSVLVIPQASELAKSTRTIMQALTGPLLSIAEMVGDDEPNDGDILAFDEAAQGWTSIGSTGDGDILRSDSPAITGHPTIEGVTSTGATGAGKLVFDTAPAIVGGTIGGLTSFGLRSSGTGAFDLQITNTEDLTAARTLNVTLNNAARVINLAGDLTLAKNFTTAGAYNLILTQTADTNVTLPTTGTLATLDGSETFTNKTLASPVLTGTPTGPGFLFGVSQGSLASGSSLVTAITAGLAVIKGIGSGGYQFIDVVIYAFFGTPTVVASVALGSPGARTYAADSSGALKISLVSDAQAPYAITSTQMLS